MKVEGQQVERENGGAEGVEFGEGVSPSLMREGLGRMLCPLPRKFLIFSLGMLHFGCNLMHFHP